jgi:chorismate synthase
VTVGDLDLSLEDIEKAAAMSEVSCADADAGEKMKSAIDLAKGKGDTLGGIFEVLVTGAPPGLGSYAQWDRRLDGRLAQALVAIPAVKAVSIGEGVNASGMKGSDVHDAIVYDKKSKKYSRVTNNAGGLEGGVTNGAPVVVRGYMKPIATLSAPLASVDIKTKKECRAATERSDVTAVPACAVIAEASVAVEMASAFLDKFGGDCVKEISSNLKNYERMITER